MPSPPPNGRSSTVLWRSCVQSRRLWMRISSSPASCARFTTPCANGPAKNSGKIVSTWKITAGSVPCRPAGNSTAMRFAAGSISTQMARAKGISKSPSTTSRPVPPPSCQSVTRPEALPGAPVHHFAAHEVGFEEFAGFERRALRQRDAHFRPVEQFGVGNGIDAAEFEDQRAVVKPSGSRTFGRRLARAEEVHFMERAGSARVCCSAIAP